MADITNNIPIRFDRYDFAIVGTIAERDAINVGSRDFGMTIVVISDPTPSNNGTYQLANIDLGGVNNDKSDNSNWIPFGSTSASGEAVGSFKAFATTAIPANYLWCNGAVVAIATYPDLYAVIGTTFGGDGVTTFGLPDMQGRFLKGDDGSDIGTSTGSNTLTVSNLPPHRHDLLGTNDNTDSDEFANTYLSAIDASGVGANVTTPSILYQSNPASIGLTGSNTPHEHPNLSVRWAICFESVGANTVSPTPSFNAVLAVDNDSPIRALYNGIPYVAENEIPIFLDETSTIGDFASGNTYFYIGATPITYDYDLEPYPLPVPASGFNFVNLSVYDVTFNSGGGNYVYTLTPNQRLQDIQIVDNGVWELYPTLYVDNIYDLQQVTSKGATTTDAIVVRNNPDNYRTRYSTVGQQIQYGLGDRNVDYTYNRIQVNKPSNLASWTLNFPDIDSNTPLTNTIVNFRPTLGGTVAYLSDIDNAIYLTETSTIADIQPNKLHFYVGMAGNSLDYTTIGGVPQPPNPAPTGQNFDIINLSNYTISIDFDNGGFNINRLQGYQDIQIVDNGNGYWEMQATTFFGNTLQEITTNGNTTSNNIQLNGSQLVFSNFFSNARLRVNPSNENLQIGSNSSSFWASLGIGLLTADRSYSFPNNSGTLALLSDIPISTTETYLAPVISQINTPPITPNIGDRFLVGTLPTGVWVGFDNQIAEWDGLDYVYTVPVLDNVVYVTDTLTTLRFGGAVWVNYIGTALLQNGNSLGSSVIFGTKDNYTVRFVQNNGLVGHINTNKQLVLSDDTLNFTPFDANSSLEIAANGVKAKSRITRFSSNTTGALYEGYKARGTISAPLDAVANDGILGYIAQARVNGTFQQTGGGQFSLASISATNQPVGAFSVTLGNGAGATVTNFSLLNRSLATSGTVNFSLLGNFNFDPTSGTAIANLLNLNGTFNQTGGASGITRGLHINPTLTAVADFRALEINTGAGANATHIKLVNSTTGSAPLDGSDITLSGINLILNNKEAGEINFFTNNTQKGSFDSDGGLTLFNLATDRYALSITNAVDDNNYTKFTGSSVEYLLGFQTSRFLIKNNTTNTDLLTYTHTTNTMSLGATTVNQNVINLFNSNAGYGSASIGLNSTRKFYYTDGTTVRFWVKPTNVISTDTTGYETLVLADNDIPNRKFVVDLVASQIVQNGNSFGATMVIGTNDNNSLSFETNGTTKFTISPLGAISHTYSDTTGTIAGLNIYNNAGTNGWSILRFSSSNSSPNPYEQQIVCQAGQFSFQDRSNSRTLLGFGSTINSMLYTLGDGSSASATLQVTLAGQTYTTQFGSNASRKFYIQENSVVRIEVGSTNVINTNTPNYENLIVADGNLTNKKYVDDRSVTTDRQQNHTAGATVTISNGISILYVNPASTLASLTITMPSAPNNGQEVKISFGGTLTSGTVITALSIIGNSGHTILAGSTITTADAGDGYVFKFESSTNLWRIF